MSAGAAGGGAAGAAGGGAAGAAGGGAAGGGAAGGGAAVRNGDRDPGLQPERTRLAWRRTTLTCSITAVLAVRQALRGPASAPEIAGAAFIALVWVAFLVVAHGRIRELASARPPGLAPRRALATTVATLVLAVFAAAVII
ncbi:DUF202 domain-containing protein [Streptomyces sp. NPDC089799]|uniref:DUF202 domain-containing protein n=1 Tax=Streptomyces sp. NPDC089799 TaxID=3155066 RepID=UPI00341F2488